ncbi:conserved protein of unknown function [Methylacidimicrobium sp. AP8]|nr:conserved protein of unknown function [Methylacidimicrobium sp. AP8]
MSVLPIPRRRGSALALFLAFFFPILCRPLLADPPLPSADPAENSAVDAATLRKLDKQAEREEARREKEARKAAELERKRLEKERQEAEKEMRRQSKRSASIQPPVRAAIPVGRQAPPRVLAAIWSQLVPSRKISALVIHVREQKLYVYQGKTLAAIAPICTGDARHPTPLGRFTVIQKDRNHLSNRYGCFVDNATGRIVDANAVIGQRPPPGTHYEAAEMPHFLRITADGIGLHGGYLPGFAASHGCIRLPKSFASEIFELVQDGTPVMVVE